MAVRPLPPFYLDFIELVLPYKEQPKRRKRLIAGDWAEYPYTPPEEEPELSDVEEHDLWALAQDVEVFNTDVDKKRKSSRVDFLLSTCVDILDGPISIQDDSWVQDLEGAFPTEHFRVPTHPGIRKVMFLKTRVITHVDDRDWILETATYKEVTMTGITVALQSYKVIWDGVPLLKVLKGDERSSVEYDVRLYEAECAAATGLPFDHHWYSIPVTVREHMIAARLARVAIDNLAKEQAVERAKSKR